MEISHTEKLLFERTLEKLSQAEKALGEARMDMHMLLLKRQQLSAPEQSGESVGQSATEQQAAEQRAAMPSAPFAPAPQPPGVINPAGPRINPGVPHINPGAANPPVQPAPLTRPPIQPTPVYSAQTDTQPPEQPRSQADQVLPARSGWWTSEQNVVRVIATLGTLITIAGVFFLVVLAIQNGLLGPLGRVILASVFSAVMGGIGVVAHKRHAHKAAVGAFCTTSLLSAMATVFSLVVILEWWPEPAGTATIIALTIGFIALATVWNEEGVAIALGIGASIVGSIYFASCVNYVEFSTLPGTLAPTALAIAAYIRKWSKGIDIAVIVTLITAFFYALLSDSPAMILPTTPVVVITAIIFVAMGANTERTPWNPLLTIAAPAVLFGLGALGLEAMPSLSTHVSTRPLSWVLIAGSICYIAIAIVNHNKALIQSGSVFLALSFLPVYVTAAPLGTDVLLNKPMVVCIFLVTSIGVTWWMTSGIKFRGGVWFCWAATALILTYMVADGVLSGTFLGYCPSRRHHHPAAGCFTTPLRPKASFRRYSIWACAGQPSSFHAGHRVHSHLPGWTIRQREGWLPYRPRHGVRLMDALGLLRLASRTVPQQAGIPHCWACSSICLHRQTHVLRLRQPPWTASRRCVHHFWCCAAGHRSAAKPSEPPENQHHCCRGSSASRGGEHSGQIAHA